MRVFWLLCAIIIIAQAKLYFIDFAGNQTFEKEQLYEELGLKRSWWQKFKKELPQIDEKLLPALYEELELFYKEQGFWDASITTTIRNNNTIVFIIQENRPIIIKNIAITSNFPIKNLLTLKVNERFIIPEFIKSKEYIKKALLQKGYCSYTFNPKAYILHKKHSAYIAIYLDKGKICTIKDLQISGTTTISPKVVLDHIYIHKGDRFSKAKIDESYKRLYSLGYFRTIHFDYSKKVKNRVTLAIYLKERQKKHLYKVGVGFESDQGFISSFAYKNFNFYTHQPQITLRYSRLKKQIAFNLFTPSIWQGYDMSNSIAYVNEEFKQFKSRSISLRSKLLKESFSLAYSFGIEAEKIDIYSASSCVPTGSSNFIAPFAKLLIDKRNSKVFPTGGYFLLADIASSLTTTYLFASGELGYYLQLHKAILFGKAKLAQIFAPTSLPPTKLLYAGGIKSNRAYSYRSIGALNSPCGLGGKSLLETTIEFRYPVMKGIYTALFWDRTYLNAKTLRFNKSVDGVGIGALVPLQIGTIKAYFGFNPSDFSRNFLGLYIGAAF